MRIGIDCRLWDETGVGRYIKNLVLNLQKLDRKNEYVLLVLSKNQESVRYNMYSRHKNWEIVEADIRWHTFGEQIKLPQILTRENLDLVHFPYFSVPIFYNKPFVVTIHDLIIDHFPTGRTSTLPYPVYKLKLLGYKFVISEAAKKAKKIITVSNATKKEIVDHLGVDKNKVVVTYEGVNSQIKNSKKNRKWKMIDGKYFLYVGNAYPHKNLERLVEGFSLFCYPETSAEGSHDVKLVLVGKEDYFYKRLKEQIQKMKLLDKVIFLDNITDHELSYLYKNALALIIPSLMEGFGLPALEAMANKCLVLAADIPALREICNDTAVYFDPYNPKDIAEKMREVCFNDLNHFSEKIGKGLERTKLFSWEKMTRQTLRVYEDSASL